MLLSEIVEKLNATVIVDNPTAEVNYAYTGDLLSDVMGHCGDESVLITVQNHLNTIAVCTLVGAEAIVLCHSRPAPADMVTAATRERVAILTTPLSQYAASLALSLPPSVK